MARIQAAQATQSVADQISRIERELLQARQAPIAHTPLVEEVARQMQQDLAFAQRLQGTFAHAPQQDPVREVPRATMGKARPEKGLAFQLDPLEL